MDIFMATLASFRERFRSGAFDLAASESINAVVTSNDVPACCGVYVISARRGKRKEFLYIGKSGTMQRSGAFKRQTLRKRLTMKQDGMYRRDYFKALMAEHNLAFLSFEWFVTFEREHRMLPAFAEAQLFQAFYDDCGRLPLLNKSA